MPSPRRRYVVDKVTGDVYAVVDAEDARPVRRPDRAVELALMIADITAEMWRCDAVSACPGEQRTPGYAARRTSEWYGRLAAVYDLSADYNGYRSDDLEE